MKQLEMTNKEQESWREDCKGFLNDNLFGFYLLFIFVFIILVSYAEIYREMS